jgi:hypothetical protein
VFDSDLKGEAHVPAKIQTPALSLGSPTVVPALLNGSAFDFNGAFSGHYATKTCLDTVTLARVGREQINATKVTGTKSVPAGKITFYFNAATLIGYGRLAQDGFVRPYWSPITVQPAGSIGSRSWTTLRGQSSIVQEQEVRVYDGPLPS